MVTVNLARQIFQAYIMGYLPGGKAKCTPKTLSGFEHCDSGLSLKVKLLARYILRKGNEVLSRTFVYKPVTS